MAHRLLGLKSHTYDHTRVIPGALESLRCLNYHFDKILRCHSDFSRQICPRHELFFFKGAHAVYINLCGCGGWSTHIGLCICNASCPRFISGLFSSSVYLSMQFLHLSMQGFRLCLSIKGTTTWAREGITGTLALGRMRVAKYSDARMSQLHCPSPMAETRLS